MLQSPKPAAPYRELLPITLAVMTGVLSTSFSAIFTAIALPDLMAEYAVSHGTAHWLIPAFVTCATLTMRLAGWGANRVGVRTLFMGALMLFILSSLLGGFGASIHAVITARALQ